MKGTYHLLFLVGWQVAHQMSPFKSDEECHRNDYFLLIIPILGGYYLTVTFGVINFKNFSYVMVVEVDNIGM